MCGFCEERRTIFSMEKLDDWVLGWDKDAVISSESAIYSTIGVFIDRGFLRMVDLDDSQCLDHGSKVAINYCPLCGMKLNNLV